MTGINDIQLLGHLSLQIRAQSTQRTLDLQHLHGATLAVHTPHIERGQSGVIELSASRQLPQGTILQFAQGNSAVRHTDAQFATDVPGQAVHLRLDAAHLLEVVRLLPQLDITLPQTSSQLNEYIVYLGHVSCCRARIELNNF